VKRAAVLWVFFVCFACGSFYEAAKLPFGNVSAPGAGFFPVVLAVLLAVISLLGLITASGEAVEQKNLETRLLWKKIILTVTAVLGFGALFEHAGYLVTTFLFVAFQLRVVERKGWTLASAVALCASLVSYVLFGLALGAPLPAGFLPI
jgi:putative tricarboxylic transport membrane protein